MPTWLTISKEEVKNTTNSIFYTGAQNFLLAMLSFTCGYYFTSAVDHSSPAIDGLWAVIAAILVFQTSFEETIKSAQIRIFSSLIGSVIASVYLSIFSFSVLGLGICTFLGIIICYVFHVPDRVRITSVSIAVIMLISSVNPEINPFLNGSLRFVESIVGSVVAIGVSLIPIPKEIIKD